MLGFYPASVVLIISASSKVCLKHILLTPLQNTSTPEVPISLFSLLTNTTFHDNHAADTPTIWKTNHQNVDHLLIQWRQLEQSKRHNELSTHWRDLGFGVSNNVLELCRLTGRRTIPTQTRASAVLFNGEPMPIIICCLSLFLTAPLWCRTYQTRTMFLADMRVTQALANTHRASL